MNQRPGFFFLVCPDPEMLHVRVQRLLTQAGGGFARQVFWGDAEDFGPAWWQALAAVSLFAEPKVLVLRRAEELGQDFWDKLVRPLAGFNEHVWPVICLEAAHDPKKGPPLPKGLDGSPYWKVAQDKGWLWISPGLTEQTMVPTLKDWAGAHRLQFGPGVLQELVRVLPKDMAACARELEKLELAAVGGVINADSLGLVSAAAGLDIFGFLKALEEGRDPAGVWRTVLGHQQASDDGFLFQFLAVLTREARTMWQLAHDDPDCRVHPYVRKLKTPMALRLGASGLAAVWDLAMEAECSVKSGRKHPDQALEMLAAGLTLLFARTGSGWRG